LFLLDAKYILQKLSLLYSFGSLEKHMPWNPEVFVTIALSSKRKIYCLSLQKNSYSVFWV